MNSTWLIDKSHREISLKVKDLMISNIKGFFDEYTGTFETNGDVPIPEAIPFDAEAKSINTKSRNRDNHFWSADFLDVINFPHIISKGKPFDSERGTMSASGELALKNTPLPVILSVVSNGTAPETYGQVKKLLTVEGKIRLNKFEISCNSVTETDGVVVSDKLHIPCEIRFKQPK